MDYVDNLREAILLLDDVADCNGPLTADLERIDQAISHLTACRNVLQGKIGRQDTLPVP